MGSVPETGDNAADAEESARCPACGADASYRYGRAWNGKARRICLICNRQYVAGADRPDGTQRPLCPVCRQPMHVYRRQTAVIRYRCRNYPACRNYVKVDTGTSAAGRKDAAPEA